jgi:hypothetical protein
MHTLTTSAFEIDPSKIIKELNKLPLFDAIESGKPRHKTGDVEELKKQLSASMDNEAFKHKEKP